MPEQPRKPAQVPLVSEFANDPDMAELVTLFLTELPDRVEALSAFWREKKFKELQRLAHQLKGASAGYGFPSIGLAASKVENQLRAMESGAAPERLASIASDLNDLVSLCNRALGGRAAA